MNLASILFLLLASAVLAAAPTPAGAQVPRTVESAGGEVSVLADHFEQIGPDNLLVATGNVEVIRGTSRLLADRVEINRETGDVVAEGRVIFYDGDDRLTGQRIEYNMKTGTGVVYNGEAHTAPYYRLSGERMERLGEGVYRVRNSVFTTCEDDPPAWSFHMGSSNAALEDYVYGWNVSFWAKSIPVIPYFPFFASALRSERQSGFLSPLLGQSAKKGFFAEVPFYWVISDSQDATLTFDVYQRLGIGGAAEYRYIISREQKGLMSGFFVDEVFKQGDLRGYGTVKHDWQIQPGLSLRADLNAVSDDAVFRDYQTDLAKRSVQRAESNLFLTKTWPNWTLVSRIFWYQDLTTPRPVELQRIPEITLTGGRQALPGLPGTLYQLDASVANFFRYIGSEGARVDVHPVVIRPIPLAGYGSVTPFVGGRLTAYSTTVTGTHVPVAGGPPVEDTNGEPRLRDLLEFGSDAASAVSRVYDLGGWGGLDRVRHSIEPGVHYIRIIGHNFYSLPLWTNLTDFIPEANWAEYSLTNRIVGSRINSENAGADRLELAKLVVAGAYDFEKSQFGNIASDLTIQPTPTVRLHGDMSYNILGQGLQAYTTDVSVNLPPVVGTVGTRYNRQPAEIIPYFVQIPGTFNPGQSVPADQGIHFLQGAVSVNVFRNLVARASTNWNIATSTLVETRYGADLKFDCWALSLEYVRRAPDRPGKNPDNEFRFSLNLLGLGNVVTTRVGGVGTDSEPTLK